MGRASGAGVSARLKGLRGRVERWRRTRAKRAAMPAELWAEAVRAAAQSGEVYRVARALRVNFDSLKRRVVEAAQRGGAATEVGRFVELSGAQILGASAATGSVLELSDRDGVRLTIRLGGGERLNVAELVQGFWSRRA